MKPLGVFVTTYISPSGRHGGAKFGQDLWNRFSKLLVPNYLKYQPGIDMDITFLDTGSSHPGYMGVVNSAMEQDKRFKYRKVPNVGGASCGIKYVMHGAPELMDEYEHFFFAVDDTVYVEGDNWAKELVHDYVSNHNLGKIGLMGRNVRTLPMAPDGVVKPGMCVQVPRMWNCRKLEIIPHVHEDWWMIDRETIKDLSKVWYDPIHSKESMEYIKQYENMDFQKVWTMGAHYKNFHVGREIDTPIRITRLLQKNMLGYDRLSGEKVFARPIF